MIVKQTLEAAGSAVDLAAKIAQLIARARASQQAERQVLLYLDAAQQAVEGLKLERQKILRAARLCDVRDPAEVAALHEALVSYLQVDTIRPELQKAIDGLAGCRAAIGRSAQVRWRPRLGHNRAEALELFDAVSAELDDLLQRRLIHDGLPGYSGMLVHTLVPILAQTEAIRRGTAGPPETAEADLADRVLDALDDASERDWIALAGRVETLKAKISLAFAVEVLRED
jgi:hypothetical protein